jgi:hypothetical protein
LVADGIHTAVHGVQATGDAPLLDSPSPKAKLRQLSVRHRAVLPVGHCRNGLITWAL